MRDLSKKEAQRIIAEYFSGNKLNLKKTKKIKKLAMTYRIRLGEYRKRFCKKCYSDLKIGKLKITRSHKKVICPKCGNISRWKINN